MATDPRNAPDLVCEWFMEHPGRATLDEILNALSQTWHDEILCYSGLNLLLNNLVVQGFLERVDALDRESGMCREYWQRPHGAERPQDGIAGEIPTIIRLDEASAETVTRLLEESPGPNEAMQGLFQDTSVELSGYVCDTSLTGDHLSGGGPTQLTGDHISSGPLFTNLSDGSDPREHVSTNPRVRLHPPGSGVNHELAVQAFEATKQVLAKKDKDEFAEWVKEQFANIDRRIDGLEERARNVEIKVERLQEGFERKINNLGEQLGQVGEWALRGTR